MEQGAGHLPEEAASTEWPALPGEGRFVGKMNVFMGMLKVIFLPQISDWLPVSGDFFFWPEAEAGSHDVSQNADQTTAPLSPPLRV